MGEETAIVKRQDDTLVARPAEMRMLAQDLLNSGMFQNAKNIAGVIAIIQTGHELGIPPATSLNVMSIINGRLTLEAKALLAVAQRRAGVSWKVLQETNDLCEMEFSRTGFSPITVSFTAKEAQDAGLLSKSNWKNYRRDMLFARCASRGIRRIAPDAVLGLYSTEEMRDVPTGGYSPTGVPEKMQPCASEAPRKAIVETVGDITDAEIIGEDDKSMDDEEKEDLFGKPVVEEPPPSAPAKDRLAEQNIVTPVKEKPLLHEGLRDGLIQAIKESLKAEDIPEKEFKEWLDIYQTASTPPRHYVGMHFGNRSFREADIDDLKYLHGNLIAAIKKYRTYKKKQGV